MLEAVAKPLTNSGHAPSNARIAAMKALLCTRYGTPDDLEFADVPEPQAGPGEVVVRIAAAALNFCFNFTQNSRIIF